MSSKIIRLPYGRKAATGQNRRVALDAILQKILVLQRSAPFYKSLNFSPTAQGSIGYEYLTMTRFSATSIYVVVGARERLFSATVNTLDPASIHLHYWRRPRDHRWEALLFDEPWLNTRPGVYLTQKPASRRRRPQLEALLTVAETAAARDRSRAASVIARRLRQALAGLSLPVDPGETGQWIFTRIGSAQVSFGHSPEGMYFRVEHGGQPVMTGYLDPPNPGKYCAGKLAVMTWKRGWEGSLFEKERSPAEPVQILEFSQSRASSPQE